MAKKQVTLIDNNGRSRLFDFDHAERILQRPRSSWKLKDDKHTFKNGKLAVTSNTRNTKESGGKKQSDS
jgi:hypothetical protein